MESGIEAGASFDVSGRLLQTLFQLPSYPILHIIDINQVLSCGGVTCTTWYAFVTKATIMLRKKMENPVSHMPNRKMTINSSTDCGFPSPSGSEVKMSYSVNPNIEKKRCFVTLLNLKTSICKGKNMAEQIYMSTVEVLLINVCMFVCY